MSARELLIEVELAVLAGRSLEQIEAEMLADWGLDEESQSAVWLYAWSYREAASREKPAYRPDEPRYAHRDR
jgi:hypothetical protein